jgi:hypothetical protein
MRISIQPQLIQKNLQKFKLNLRRHSHTHTNCPQLLKTYILEGTDPAGTLLIITLEPLGI